MSGRDDRSQQNDHGTGARCQAAVRPGQIPSEDTQCERRSGFGRFFVGATIVGLCTGGGLADDPPSLPRAFVDGKGSGWKTLGDADFTKVNCDPETWVWKDGLLHVYGVQPVGSDSIPKSRTSTLS